MDSDDTVIEKLINQCKSNDVDVKVDALTKLQAEFESGIEIHDHDALINVLKTCLRTSNQHLTTATLAALPPLLPLLISRSVNPHASGSRPRSASSSTSSVNPSAVVDAVTLRQVLTAFLPAGGVIDRFGDKEKAQTKARETVVILAGLAFRAGGSSAMSTKSRDKGPETPLMIFERFLREGGLASKVWRVREQSILALVHIRRAQHQFPIRPYLPLLVDCLEDTDAHVRDCARQSVVELFSGPAVNDGARADLKKEMTKKGVRKAIVDGVLSKLLSGSAGGSHSRENSESGDAAAAAAAAKSKEYLPPSLALLNRKPSQGSGLTRTASNGSVKEMSSRPASRTAMAPSPVPTSPPTTENAEIRPVYITSGRDLENEFAAMLKPFDGRETEHNWAAREQAILLVRGMLKGDVHLRYMDIFLGCLKEGFIQWSLKTLNSLRTTVSMNTSSLYTELATTLGPSLDPFCDVLLTNLLKMAGLTKKIAAQQSQASVSAIIKNTSAQPRTVLSLLWNTLQEKTPQSRTFAVAHLKTYIIHHGHRSKTAIDASGGLETMEKSLKKALSDTSPPVRESARLLFWAFEEVWPDRGSAILETLDHLVRKQVEKVCPKPEELATLPPTTPKNAKKSSVAAAIAASRAKAKVIATAPPTLRHQATSMSHVLPSKRAGSPMTSPRSSMDRPASPLRFSSSSSSPSSPSSPPFRVRVASGGMTRSVSATTPKPAAVSHSRVPSRGSDTSISPPSPSELSNFRRRTSSPLANTGPSANRTSSIRRAIQTALPVSPPSSTGQVSPPPPNHSSNILSVVPPPPAYNSGLFPPMTIGLDETLLLAQTIPIPDDASDSDDDRSVNLMTFSTPFEVYPPMTPVSNSEPKSNSRIRSPSQKSDSSKPTIGVSNALSSDSITDLAGPGQPVVEDALRARAEQAESAAERLLELVEPEEDGAQLSTIPASLLVGSTNGHVTMKSKGTKNKPAPISLAQAGLVTPVTPMNRQTAILKQAAMFKDSPEYSRRRPSLVDVLHDRKHETGWWLKRRALVGQATSLKTAETSDRVQELQECIVAVVKGDPGTHILQRLALLCLENPVTEPPSPPPSPGLDLPTSPSPFNPQSLPSLHSDMWDANKNFDRLFRALIQFLEPSKSEEELEYGLIIIWEMLENQAPYLEGKEADLFSVLFRVRYCNKLNVLEATNTIRDALTTSIDPVYGLTTLHACLRAFHAESLPAFSDEDIKSAVYAFGLIALGKFIMRLPGEIAEEELPRLKGTLISSLNDKSSLIVRESAAASIIAAQLVLRDETHLFALLDGLADEKKNLLTYLFDKHGARGLTTSNGNSGMDKLEKEIRRLDTRTNTPSRFNAA